jgi:hypothetical protein
MTRKTIWRALWLTAAVALAPAAARAEGLSGTGPTGTLGYAPPDCNLWAPLYSTRPEAGGVYLFGEFVFIRENNPLRSQGVATRGFVTTSNNVTDFNGNAIPIGTFVGPGTVALDTHQATGPNNYQPGFTVGAGWKFADGSDLSVSWMYLTRRETLASATLAPPGLRINQDFSNTFLFSPVFGFPSDFSGPAQKIDPARGGAGSVFGIWNGASIMTESYRQYAEQVEATYRLPIFDTECYRISGLVGPRFWWFWDRYKWVTNDLDNLGNGAGEFGAVYTNIDSNRLYGIHCGFQQEWYAGCGFACTLKTEAALLADLVKTEVRYRSAVRELIGFPQSKRSRHYYTIVPEFDVKPSLSWYPLEGVELHVGYNFMAFFNTVASEHPIDFNYGSVDPKFDRVFRFLDGFDIGLSFVF